MSRQNEPLVRHNILLTEGTYAKLQAIYGETVGAAGAIRLLIKRHLDEIEKAKSPLELNGHLEENGL